MVFEIILGLGLATSALLKPSAWSIGKPMVLLFFVLVNLPILYLRMALPANLKMKRFSQVIIYNLAIVYCYD